MSLFASTALSLRAFDVSSRTFFSIIFSVSLILTAWFTFQVLSLTGLTTALPLGDYIGIIIRYDGLMTGRLNLLDFFFMKHADHNHFSAYFLGFLDIVFNNGRQHLLLWTLIFCHVFVFFFYLFITSKLIDYFIFPIIMSFAAGQIFGLYSAEVWVYPFQVVLASFRLLLVVGLALTCLAFFCTGAVGMIYFSLGMMFLLMAALSHGSGIAVFPLVILLFMMMFRDLSVRMRNDYIIIMIVPLLLFALHGWFYRPATSFTNIIGDIPVSEIANVPLYVGFLLGHHFLFKQSHALQTAVGLGGIIVLAVSIVWILLNRKSLVEDRHAWMRLFLMGWGLFSLGSALLSVLLNLGYMDFRGIPQATNEYFLASRYAVTTSGFWLATVALAASTARQFSSRVGHSALMTFLAISVGTTIVHSTSLRQGWVNMLTDQNETEAAVRCDVWQQWEPHELEQKLHLPPGMYPAGAAVLQSQKHYNLGPYASPCRSRVPLNISDMNWNHGVGIAFSGTVVLNNPENRMNLVPGRVVTFREGTRRAVVKQETSGIYLNIFFEGEPLDGEGVGYPHEFEIMP